MNKKTKIFLLAVILSTTFSGLFTSGQFALAGGESSKKKIEFTDTIFVEETQRKQNAVSDTVIPLKEAKLNIEHNDKDKDTGFQGFIDSEGWNRISLIGPDGNKVLEFKGMGKLGSLGLTELFFETVEPANDDVPIAEVLETLPEGNYSFEGSAIEVGDRQGKTLGTAWLTHVIPKGPVLVSPVEDAEVPVADLLVSWDAVDETIDGADVNIISYQLNIEKNETPHQHMIGKRGLSMYLPATVTQITIPGEFFESGTHYSWEVLAIEESGNQSLTSSQFSTEE